MDFCEKAKIRLQHWLSHNLHHIEEYRSFLEELEKQGQVESAKQLRYAIDLIEKSNEYLQNAIKSLRR